RQHRKTQAVGLAGAVVGVLAQDDHLHLVEGRGVEGGKDARAGREDVLARRFFLTQESREFLHLRALQVVADPGLPARLEADAVAGHPTCRAWPAAAGQRAAGTAAWSPAGVLRWAFAPGRWRRRAAGRSGWPDWRRRSSPAPAAGP